jgi:hypothetical protein
MTALIFSAALALCIGSYLLLSSNSLKLAHRTFLADSAVNLAETGLEEAVWSFNKMARNTDPSSADFIAAWTNWNKNTTIADIYLSNNGTGYTSVPTVTISGGGGSGATAVATIRTVPNGFDASGAQLWKTEVGTATLTNPGTGYTSSPTVTLNGGGGTGATAEARLSATRTLTFSNLGAGGASGTVKVWVDGYNGTATLPIIVAKATISPPSGARVEKQVKVILSKYGVLPKGVVAFDGINWNGHPLADSYLSSTTPGVPPFNLYTPSIARSNTTVASLDGTIDLSQGSVDGNVLTGPGVTVVGHGDISGQTIGNFSYPFSMPSAPTGVYYNPLGSTMPSTLPRTTTTTDPVTHVTTTVISDTAASDGKYYYTVSNVTIGNLTVTAGKSVVISGTNTSMATGLVLQVNNATSQVAKADFYIDGPISLSGNDQINATASTNYNWAGSLQIYTTTTQDCTFSGNAKFYGCLTAPNAALVGNGGGHDMVDMCGSFIVGSVTSNGHMNFHYDENLASLTTGKAWGLSLWKELQSTSDRAIYSSQLNF